MSPEAIELLAFCRADSRVCPLPIPWNELWELLPEPRRVGAGWSPPLPLILAAWGTASSQAKTERFAEHIAWADSHGALAVISAFLHSLREDQWLHVGEWPA